MLNKQILTLIVLLLAFISYANAELIPENNQVALIDNNNQQENKSICGDKADTLTGLCALDEDKIKPHMDALQKDIIRGIKPTNIKLTRVSDQRIDLSW